MLTVNLDVDDRLINGQMGTIFKIKFNDTHNAEIIYVNFDDENSGRTLIQKSGDLFAIENNAVPVTRVLSKIKMRIGKPASPEIQRTQFLLKLARACTIHKVQGLTIGKVVFSFQLFKQRQFNFGQVYVALSRVQSLKDLYILGSVNTAHIGADPRVVNEYARLRLPSMHIAVSEFPNPTTDNIVISLLNIRPLKTHYIDLRYDIGIINSDVIALAETFVRPSDGIDFIQRTFDSFDLMRQDHHDHNLSLAILPGSKYSYPKTVLSPTKWLLCRIKKESPNTSDNFALVIQVT